MSLKLPGLHAISLLATMGPIHRSSVRFETPVGVTNPPAVVPPAAPAIPAPAAAAPAAPASAASPEKPPSILQRFRAHRAAAAGVQPLVVQLDEARGTIRQGDTALATMTQERDRLAADNARLTSENEEGNRLMAEMMDEAADVDRAASARAAAIAGGQGIPERSLPALKGEGGGGPDRSKELLAQYNQLMADGKSTEAGEFFAKHEKEILT
jgi:hypothetical protein